MQDAKRSLYSAARLAKVTPARRQEIAQIANAAKRARAAMPRATHGSVDRPLQLGGVDIPCFVLSDGTRILSQNGLFAALGITQGGAQATERRISPLFTSTAMAPYVPAGLLKALDEPINYLYQGGRPPRGYPATILVDICEAVLAAKDAGALPAAQMPLAARCGVLLRGYARVGIVAMVDEATGYQQDRARDALAKVLEEWVAKELKPYLKRFPEDFYTNIARLWGVKLDTSTSKMPQYFGNITNNIIYDRLAPGVREELKEQTRLAKVKAGNKHPPHMHQFLTDKGVPKLSERIIRVCEIMKYSEDREQFEARLDERFPVFVVPDVPEQAAAWTVF